MRKGLPREGYGGEILEPPYRGLVSCEGLFPTRVLYKESDLFILAERNLKRKALKSLLRARASIEEYIKRRPDFLYSLSPIDMDDDAPFIVKEMILAGIRAGVGPMASVAGAIAQAVGMDLMEYSGEVIVENGGDIFMALKKERFVGIYSGDLPVIRIRIRPKDTPLGVCTSSGRFGHSLSLGEADSVTVISPSCPLADALATRLANMVKDEGDVEKAVSFGKSVDGVKGIVVIKGGRVGIWGVDIG